MVAVASCPAPEVIQLQRDSCRFRPGAAGCGCGEVRSASHGSPDICRFLSPLLCCPVCKSLPSQSLTPPLLHTHPQLHCTIVIMNILTTKNVGGYFPIIIIWIFGGSKGTVQSYNLENIENRMQPSLRSSLRYANVALYGKIYENGSFLTCRLLLTFLSAKLEKNTQIRQWNYRWTNTLISSLHKEHSFLRLLFPKPKSHSFLCIYNTLIFALSNRFYNWGDRVL